MNRKKTISACMVGMTVLGVGVAMPSMAEQARPNIVLIYVDDMGLGEYGGGLIPTPAIDSLARDGMEFTDAHTSSSVCTPSRYSILTGRYNWRSYLKSNVIGGAGSKALMTPEMMSMPAFLQQSGYHTACIGKWHLGADFEHLPKTTSNPNPDGPATGNWAMDYTQPVKNGPTDVGFDEAFWLFASLDFAPYTYFRGNKAVTVPTVNKGFRQNEHSNFMRIGPAAEDFDPSTCLETWTEEACDYIQRRAKAPEQNPFFLYFALTSPHTPIVPGKGFKGCYPQYSWYADFIAETDYRVGQVLEQLQSLGLDDNTIVIFSADNGFASYVQIPKMFEAGYRPNGAWRNGKANLYEGGHRVPFLVRWPGKVKPGSRSDVTICQTDLYATFSDILGNKDTIPVNAAVDSFSFLSSLKGDSTPTRPFTIHHSINGNFAIRRGDWKLLLTDRPDVAWSLPFEKGLKTPAKLVQLYNLKDDPGETKNLEYSHPELIQVLVDQLVKAMRYGRTTPGPVQENEGWPYKTGKHSSDVQKTIVETFPQLGGADQAVRD